MPFGGAEALRKHPTGDIWIDCRRLGGVERIRKHMRGDAARRVPADGKAGPIQDEGRRFSPPSWRSRPSRRLPLTIRCNIDASGVTMARRAELQHFNAQTFALPLPSCRRCHGLIRPPANREISARGRHERGVRLENHNSLPRRIARVSTDAEFALVSSAAAPKMR